jgi:hypothetical protein
MKDARDTLAVDARWGPRVPGRRLVGSAAGLRAVSRHVQVPRHPRGPRSWGAVGRYPRGDGRGETASNLHSVGE